MVLLTSFLDPSFSSSDICTDSNQHHLGEHPFLKTKYLIIIITTITITAIIIIISQFAYSLSSWASPVRVQTELVISIVEPVYVPSCSTLSSEGFKADLSTPR